MFKLYLNKDLKNMLLLYKNNDIKDKGFIKSKQKYKKHI